ncbi:hypothetical protein [Dongia sp.]|uniref:hypothetical protein n=1 Tax=Dongia sp. TaxID=1977262 RepID=UPI0035AF077F
MNKLETTHAGAGQINETQRTTTSVVTFARPFRLDGMIDTFPAGTYQVETDEELLQGVSFPAYRRVATVMQQVLEPPRPNMPVISVGDPRQLDLALVIDRAEGALDRADIVLPMDEPQS